MSATRSEPEPFERIQQLVNWLRKQTDQVAGRMSSGSGAVARRSDQIADSVTTETTELADQAAIRIDRLIERLQASFEPPRGVSDKPPALTRQARPGTVRSDGVTPDRRFPGWSRSPIHDPACHHRDNRSIRCGPDRNAARAGGTDPG